MIALEDEWRSAEDRLLNVGKFLGLRMLPFLDVSFDSLLIFFLAARVCSIFHQFNDVTHLFYTVI